MTILQHLQFLALMLPTVVLLTLATISLAEPDFEFLCARPAALAAVPHAMDDAGYETAY